MSRLGPSIVVGALLALFSAVSRASPAEFFESNVRPVLVAKCYGCHKAKTEGGLRLDSRAGLLSGGNSGPAMVPGDAAASLLIQAITRSHKRVKMPPDKPLEQHEIAAITQWVAQGAEWPQSPAEFFRNQIKPILEKNCLQCHGDEPEGGLRLTTRQALLNGGDSGAAIVPGRPGESLLIQAVQRAHADLKMPPSKPLKAEQVSALTPTV